MDDALIVLACVAPWLLYMAATRGKGRRGARMAALGLALAFLYFGIGHFAVTDDLIQMLPPQIPARRILIHITGVFEFAVALGLLTERWRRPAAVAAIIMLILFFPANVYAAIHHLGVGEHREGPAYLWIRAPLQIFLVLWAGWPLLRARTHDANTDISQTR